MSNERYEPGANPEEVLLDVPHTPTKPKREWPAWLTSRWFRSLAFLVLLVPIVVLSSGTGATLPTVFMAGTGAAMLLFNDALYSASSVFREMRYKNAEGLEQSDYSKVGSRVVGAFVWLMALGMTYYIHGHR